MLRLRLSAWSDVTSGAQDGTSGVRRGAQDGTSGVRCGAQVQLPAWLSKLWLNRITRGKSTMRSASLPID